MPARCANLLRPLLAAALLGGGAAVASAGGWHGDFAAAQAEARRLDRPLLVHFAAVWCAPCKRMDREVLYTPEVAGRLGRDFVGVKLDTEKSSDLARKLGVESVPTDVFLSPDGRVLGVMNGYRAKGDYVARADAVRGHYDQLRKLRLAGSEKTGPPVRGASDPSGPRFPTLTTPEADDPAGGPRLKSRPDGTVLLGLKGYSPVALYETRGWKKGDPRFAWEHQGLTYLMASAEELRKFQDDAEKYAPRLLGCDPVLYFDEDRAVPGSTRYAAFFADGLYLFTSPATRATFREDPDRYTRRRTVLLIEEVDPALLR